MKTTIKSVLLYIIIILTGISSCKKNSDDNPGNNTPVRIDTLTAGWTKLHPINNLEMSSEGGDIFFTDQYTGYIGSGSTGVYKSTDGGIQWQQIATTSAFNLAMTSDKKLFTVGNDQNIYRYLDGNNNPVSSNPDGNNECSDIFFLDNLQGLCTTQRNLFLTSNGGDSWSNIHNLPGIDSSYGRASVVTMSGTNAWVAYSKYILHSNGNNYSSWELDSIPPSFTNLSIRTISAPTPDVVYLATNSGYVFKSVNGGNSFDFIFKAEYLYNSHLSSDIHFVSTNTGYLSVGTRIYKTTDGGANWNKIVSIGTTDFLEIHFVDENHGWAICYDGTELKLN